MEDDDDHEKVDDDHDGDEENVGEEITRWVLSNLSKHSYLRSGQAGRS